ncbi:YaiI/YqxD family protein [Pontibacillus litoralis]|uniref:UPF0178 protein N784_14740 n=1 Tax=Pontibacillus litoralis JSM 072002 TaxID=1385512 RepID=A0A0A5G8T4_9BACI|nr:YaiI/YqxD family protein [Pontibacillus litoralis]KGX87500.1 hypothetical protein N784_14740 [Pontibacillus litoralis JSM 072002]
MNIYVDADACPVKEIIIEAGNHFEIPVTLVKSISHYSNEDAPSGVRTVYVDTGSDAADFRIMQLAVAGDIIVTQDYGLAALALSKGCQVLHHKGFLFTHENIDGLLQNRYVSAQARKAGKRTKGPKPMGKEDRMQFRSLLYKVIQNT